MKISIRKSGYLSILLIIVLLFTGCSLKSDNNDRSVSNIQDVVIDSMNIAFFDNYNGDTTGNKKRAQVSTDTPIQDYALGYYNKYFQSDDEKHYIYNSDLDTTNRLVVKDGILVINVADHVDGEEENASAALTGDRLGSYCIDMETGELLFSCSAEDATEIPRLSEEQIAKIFEPTEATTETTPETYYYDDDDTDYYQSSTYTASQDSPFERYDVNVSSGTTYIINTRSGKFHLIDGPDTDTISPSNYLETDKSKEDLINEGYKPCQRCFN